MRLPVEKYKIIVKNCQLKYNGNGSVDIALTSEKEKQ
jgi:hypothetical protein